MLRVNEKYFHKACFQCKKCKKSLATGGFFTKDGAYYCISDYQQLYGQRCAACNDYVEGEVVQTMGKTYHQKCFLCSRCNQSFQSGSKVTNTGKEVICEKCLTASPSVKKMTGVSSSSPKISAAQKQDATMLSKTGGPNDCAGCAEPLKEGQALIALDRQWHVSSLREFRNFDTHN